MVHETRLPQCEAFQCHIQKTVDEHIKESVPVRSSVEVHGQQILTLNQAHAQTMEDIREIKEDIKEINKAISEIQRQQDNISRDVKIWVLGGLFGVLMTFGAAILVGAQSYGELRKQVQINTERWSSYINGQKVQ